MTSSDESTKSSLQRMKMIYFINYFVNLWIKIKSDWLTDLGFHI